MKSNPVEDKRIRVVLNTIKLLMSNDSVHGWPHVLRVLGLSLKIARKLEENNVKVDYNVLVLAVLLHDIGRGLEDLTRIHHAVLSSRIARRILSLLGYDDDTISRVTEAIETHSYSLNKKPKSIEAMILSDADKIDAMGAIGVARAFMLSGIKGRGISETIKHFHEKLLKLENMLYLEESKNIAKRRRVFLEKFLNELLRDLEESKPSIEFIEDVDN